MSRLLSQGVSAYHAGVTPGFRRARFRGLVLLNSATSAKRLPTVRSSITNDPLSIRGVDGRSDEARRFRDLVIGFMDDCGGVALATQADMALARQAAAAVVASEKVQARIIAGDVVDMEQATRLSNIAGRHLRALRNHPGRSAKSGPSLGEYLASKSAAKTASDGP